MPTNKPDDKAQARKPDDAVTLAAEATPPPVTTMPSLPPTAPQREVHLENAERSADDKDKDDEDAKPTALDKQAEKLEAKAAAEQEKADEVAAEARRAAEKAEDEGLPRAARCPVCRSRMEKYEGSNPHKQHTAFCPEHGRMAVSRNRVVAG